MASVRKFHKYFALVLGIFLFSWIVSGVMMMLPAPKPLALASRVQPKADFSRVAVAPGEIIRNLGKNLSRPAAINRIILRGLRERPVYEVRARNAPLSLWDAVTGERVTVTPKLAELLVRDRVREDVGKATIVRVEKHTVTYPWGPLPAHRIEFENGRGTIAFVGVANGRIIFTDWRKRAWHLVTGLHEFAPLDILFHDRKLTRSLLLGVSSLTLVIVITGFCLGLLPRAKNR